MGRRVKARVDPGSPIHVGGNTYSLPSRLVGEFVDVHVGAEALDIWHGVRKVDTLPRLRGRGKHRVEYRHVEEWLTAPHVAAREGEVGVDEALRLLLEEGRPLDGEAVADALRQGRRPAAVTDVMIVDVDLTMYDRLLEPGEGHEYSIDRHEGAIDGQLEGAAPAGDAGLFRGAGAAGPAGVAELRTVPAGSDGAGDPGASRSPDRAAPAGVAAAAGEGPSGAGPQAPAAEGGAADPGPDGRGVRGPLRERAGVRESREREDARFIGDLSRIDPFGKEGLFPELWADGPGPPGGQAGPEAEPLFQEPLAVRGPGPG